MTENSTESFSDVVEELRAYAPTMGEFNALLDAYRTLAKTIETHQELLEGILIRIAEDSEKA